MPKVDYTSVAKSLTKEQIKSMQEYLKSTDRNILPPHGKEAYDNTQKIVRCALCSAYYCDRGINPAPILKPRSLGLSMLCGMPIIENPLLVIAETKQRKTHKNKLIN
jgi:hypothetical protein